jgi:hypothetical protein
LSVEYSQLVLKLHIPLLINVNLNERKKLSSVVYGVVTPRYAAAL